MKPWQKGLTICGRYYTAMELLSFSSDSIVSANTQPWEKEVFRFIINWLSDSDHIVQHSSGTTGKPKMFRLSKQSMMTSALNTCGFFKLRPGQTALLCMPVEYIAGKMMIVRSMVCELNLLLIEPRSIPEIPEHLAIDFCAMVPLQVMNLLLRRNDLQPIRKLIIGGAEVNTELENLIRPLSAEIYATYGMAETCSHVALRRLNGADRQSAYHALPDVSLLLDDRGCLVIDANYLSGKIVTNDLVKLTGPASFTWLGRYDNLINSGGIKIVPEEVESRIMENTGVNGFVVGLPDQKLGQRVVFVIEKKLTPEESALIKTEFSDILPRFWRPKEIIGVDKIPRNKAFKVDRRKLVRLLTTLYA